MEMQERIDALIRMRKEKPEHKMNWDRLRTALITEEGLLTDEQKADLNSAFKEAQQEELLKMWDDRFHEVLITGTFTEDYSIAMDNSAFGSAPIRAEGSRVTLGGNVGTGTWASSAATIATNTVKQTLTDEMVKAYAQYNEKQVDKHAK